MTNTAELRSITKTFDETKAVDDVNLEIRQGEILALLGPSGSGKTTLLKIMALIEQPTSGEVYLYDEKVNEKNAERLRLNCTMIFQKTTVFNTNVFDNVAYGLKVRKTPKERIQNEVKQALKLVGLDGFENRRARRLSGGEQQRVAIARALAINTKLLLLDEPTANLDPKNASAIEEIIAKANREKGTTVVIATHNMFQAERIPMRLALMGKGRINEVGTPAEIFGKLSKTLASFAAVENTFTGNATSAADGTTFIDIGSEIQLQTTAQPEGLVNVFVAPSDIILSRSHLESSARNVFKGRIVEISDLGKLVKLRVDAGKSFIVQITKRSFNEMGVNLDAEVFLTFKASNVQVI
jgi:tungstate transport system ATP-binding protein